MMTVNDDCEWWLWMMTVNDDCEWWLWMMIVEIAVKLQTISCNQKHNRFLEILSITEWCNKDLPPLVRSIFPINLCCKSFIVRWSFAWMYGIIPSCADRTISNAFCAGSISLLSSLLLLAATRAFVSYSSCADPPMKSGSENGSWNSKASL